MLIQQHLVSEPPSRIDLHALWDDRCAECHGHSADFARRFLHISDGRLQGRHHVDNLQLFISRHYSTPAQAAAIYAMLQAQVATPPLFRQHCSRCHGSAASLVRSTAILRDGVLLSRHSGQPMQQFLSSHRNLNCGGDRFLPQTTNPRSDRNRPALISP